MAWSESCSGLLLRSFSLRPSPQVQVRLWRKLARPRHSMPMPAVPTTGDSPTTWSTCDYHDQLSEHTIAEGATEQCVFGPAQQYEAAPAMFGAT